MVRKCGAMVKQARTGQNPPDLDVWRAKTGGSRDEYTPPLAGEARAAASRFGSAAVDLAPSWGRSAQEAGTIEARSKGVANPCEECRSPARWNSIRRSKALERMKGKRWNTWSRISR